MSLLSGLVALDLTDLKGQMCGKLLRDFGLADGAIRAEARAGRLGSRRLDVGTLCGTERAPRLPRNRLPARRHPLLIIPTHEQLSRFLPPAESNNGRASLEPWAKQLV